LSPDGNWAVWTDCFGGEYPKNQLHIYDIAKNKNYQITSGDSDNAFYEWDKPIPNAAKEPTEEDWVRDGKNAYHLHRYSEAVECYQKALLIDPNDPEAYGLMGYAYYRYGQLDEAATALERSLQIDPNLIMSHYNLALVDWAIMTDEKKFNSIVALNQIGAVLDLDPSYETKMRDDSQFKKIFKSDEYSRWALRRRTRKIYDVVSSNPENMNLYFENLNPRDEDTANSMEMINAGKEQEKGRYVVEFKTVIMPPGATHDYGSSGSENTTYWSFDWPNRKLEKLTSPDDAQGEKAPYNRCLFSHFEFDSKPVDTSQLTRSALTEGVDSWTSDNSAIDHWVRVVFDQPVTFQTLHIVWPYPAQNIHFFYQNASGQDIEITDVKKISDSRHKVSPATRIYAPQTKWTFSPVTTTHLTILQKAGEGSKNMPNQMSLDQVWTY
jgi:tetratricopeptide (TPR) repeat protein